MTSIADPMQLLNQRVLEKQAACLLAEIGTYLAAKNLTAAFKRLYFYLSQDHPQAAAHLILQDFPETAIVFSAKSTLLGFTNRDKAEACWLAYVEAVKLIADGLYDEASSHIRRARPAFAGTFEFARMLENWTVGKAKQYQHALMRGDVHSAQKLENEIDDKVAIADARSKVNALFAIECRELRVAITNGDIELNLGENKAAKVRLLDSFGNKVFFQIQHDGEKDLILIEYDIRTNRLLEYSFNSFKLSDGYAITIKPIIGTISEYFLEIHASEQLLRLQLAGTDSSITALCYLSEVIPFEGKIEAGGFIHTHIPFDKNTVLLYYQDEDLRAEKLFILDICDNKITAQHNIETLMGGELLINDSSTIAIFHYIDLHCYDRNLKHTTKYINDKYDYYQNVKVDYHNKQIYMIAGTSCYDDKRDIIDLLILDFNLNIISSYHNIYPYFRQYKFWMNDDLMYDIENGLIYFTDDDSPYCAYSYVDKTFIMRTGIPIFLFCNGVKTTYQYVLDIHRNIIILNNQTETIRFAKESLQNNSFIVNNFNNLLSITSLDFYQKYVGSVRQAINSNTVNEFIDNFVQRHINQISKLPENIKLAEANYVREALSAIVTAVREGYDREL
jgi:hypothetical protein